MISLVSQDVIWRRSANAPHLLDPYAIHVRVSSFRLSKVAASALRQGNLPGPEVFLVEVGASGAFVGVFYVRVVRVGRGRGLVVDKTGSVGFLMKPTTV